MKRRVVCNLSLWLPLSACLLPAPFQPAVVRATPAFADSVAFCRVIGHEHRPRGYVEAADKVASSQLNAGEPRTVRMIYFLPNDRPYRQSVVDTMRARMVRMQRLFGDQMEAHGYGYMTFQYEAGADGEPVVHRLDGEYDDAHYIKGTIGPVQQEYFRAYERDNRVYFIVVDNSTGNVDGYSGLASGVRNRGWSMVPVRHAFDTAAHELGHTFGLGHDFRDSDYIMSYGPGKTRLSACSAGYLSVSPYFNPEVPIETDYTSAPTVEYVGPNPWYGADTRRFTLPLHVADPDGVHQVFLTVGSPEDRLLTTEVKACRLMSGETDAVVAFEFDGVIPSVRRSSFSYPTTHQFQAQVFDKEAHFGSDGFAIARASPHHVATLTPQTSHVSSVAFSPDGKLLVAGADEGDVIVWDTATRELIGRMETHTPLVVSVAFSPDGRILASGTHVGTVTLWDVTSWQEVAVLEGHTRRVESVAFSPDGSLLASASWDATVRVWDATSWQEVAALDGHTDIVSSAAFSPDGRLLASSSRDRTVRLWDTSSWQEGARLAGHTDFIWTIAFSPCGRVLASGSLDGTVKLWDVESRSEISTLDAGEIGGVRYIRSVAFSPDGSTLAASSGHGRVDMWDVFSGEIVEQYAHPGEVNSLAYAPDGRVLAASVSRGRVELWDTSQWMAPRPVRVTAISGGGQRAAPGSVLPRPLVVEVRDQYDEPLAGVSVTFTVTEGGGRVGGRFGSMQATTDSAGQAEALLTLGPASGRHAVDVSVGGRVFTTVEARGVGAWVDAEEGDVSVWHLPRGALARLGKGGVGSGAHALALSADGGYLVVGTGVGAWVYDAQSGRYVTLCRSGGGARESVRSVSISPDGSTVATGHEGELKLWDLATGARKGYLYRPGEPLYFPVGVSSPGGEVLASGQNDGSVLLWDVASGQVAARLDGHGRGVRSLAFTPDGRVLATASEDSTVRLWDVVSREALGVLRGHGGGVTSVSFSPDGRLLASGSADGAVLLWDAASREEAAGLRGVAGAVNAVSFASGGGRLAAALNDGTVRVWDVASWDEAAVLEGGGGRIGSVAYSRDGAVMAYGAVDGAVVVHDEATGRTRRLQGFAGNDAMAVSPGGTVVASGSWQGRVVLWDAASRSALAALSAHDRHVTALSFSPGGRMLASAGADATVRLWDAGTGEAIATLPGHASGAALSFSENGGRLASGGARDGVVRVSDVARRTVIATVEAGDGFTTLALSPGGTLLATGSSAGAVTVWDVDRGRNVATLEGKGRVVTLAFSRDGGALSSVTDAGTVTVWDVETRQARAVTHTSPRVVRAAALSPGGEVLAIASGWGRITLWDAATGRQAAVLSGQSGGVDHLAFSHSGRTLASGARDGAILVWDMSAYVTPRTRSADFDGDGRVDFRDFVVFAGMFGTGRGDAGYDARFDLDWNGAIGFSDFLIFAGAFGQSA